MNAFRASAGTCSKTENVRVRTILLLLIFSLFSFNGCGGGEGDSDPPSPVPIVSTQSVTSITVTGISVAGATLNGAVNPNGSATDAWFQYGTDPSFVSYAETAHQPIGSGTASQPLSATLSSLLPWRKHYFRIVAENSFGKATGNVISFPTGEYYVAVGDSITKGSHDNYPADDTSLDKRDTGGGFEPFLNDLLTAAKGYPHTVKNEGVSGDSSEQGASKIAATLSKHPQANYFLVMYGTNDAYLPFPVPSGLGLDPGDGGYNNTYKDYMQLIIWAIKGAGKTPYLAKVPYTSDLNRDIVMIREYNEVIDELVAYNFIPVAPPDFYTYFEANPGELDDGVHPNGIGYRSMASLWRDALTTP